MRRTLLFGGLVLGACAPLAEVSTPTDAPPASPRVEVPGLEDLPARFDRHFDHRAGHRIHIQTDKPLYQPGETIWIKTWDLKARDWSGRVGNQPLQYSLVSPKGSVVLQKWVPARQGRATNDFVIPPEVQGGQYKLRIWTPDGSTTERPIVVSAYEAPRIKKKLELLRKAYGAGDDVTATIEIKRPTGQPLADHPVRATVWLDGEPRAPVALKTNAEGAGLIQFSLPSKIERGDALLTVLIEDGGITESVSKRIPIILNKVQLAFFPEGGKLVQGLETRLYFEAKTMIGKPADIDGRIIDDLGNTVADLSTYHFGLGRVAFTPSTGRTYQVEVTKPVGVTEKFPLPVAQEQGCVLNSIDDDNSEVPEIRVAVRCTAPRRVAVVASLRERMIDAAGVEVEAGKPAYIYLKSDDDALNRARGVARITLFNEQLEPLAERLVFRNRDRGLKVELKTDQERFMPREQVALTVRTTDDAGRPVPAEVALSVVDDTVISFADDKTGHMLAKLLLEPEIPGEVEEPNFFFDPKEEKSARALELLMGTRGWRTFEWRPVMNTPLPSTSTIEIVAPESADRVLSVGRRPNRQAEQRFIAPTPVIPKGAPRPPAAPMDAAPEAEPAPVPARKPPAAKPVVQLDREAPAPKEPARAKRKRADRRVGRVARAAGRAAVAGENFGEDIRRRGPGRNVAEKPLAERADRDWAKADKVEQRMQLAPVRVFPAPRYTGRFEGPRTDFRETIHWAPAVITDRTGKAVVTFYLSDAVTSFRIFAEGQAAGRIGRAEKVFESSLPFSMNVKLPLEVSAGDRLLVPLTLSNERNERLAVSVTERLGPLVRLGEDIERPQPELAPNQRASVFYPLAVVGRQGETEIAFSADAGGLKDEFIRKLNVVPLGFPQTIADSGALEKKADITVDLGRAIEGTARGKLTLYPSPVATLLAGIDGMLREPYGCFEQTSSSNYPNIMIMQYMESTDSTDPAVFARASALLDRGYRRLVGFEAKSKGYEWFGRSPAHEALTAYGVLEFADMKRVYPNVDDTMIRRTVDWLKARRDGKGGFAQDGKALDSFGRADADITNAYIVFAMVEAGYRDLPAELAAQAKSVAKTDDPYLLSLGARLLLKSGAPHAAAGRSAANRLAKLQAADGHWTGRRHSITRSTGRNLAVETTSLAAMALMTSGDHANAVRRGVEWLVKSRRGHGAFGATQATVLALKALTEYAIENRRTTSPGVVKVLVSGHEVARKAYAAGRKAPIEFTDLGQYLKTGSTQLRLVHDGEGTLPYSFAADFRTEQPANHPDAVVKLATAIAQTELKMGQTVRVTAKVTNVTDRGQPMTLVRIGVPGGLTHQTWQLKELVDKKAIAFYETRAREVILYLQEMKPAEQRSVPLDLVATVPGEYTGPASRTYLYYTDDQKFWTEPLKVRIAP